MCLLPVDVHDVIFELLITVNWWEMSLQVCFFHRYVEFMSCNCQIHSTYSWGDTVMSVSVICWRNGPFIFKSGVSCNTCWPFILCGWGVQEGVGHFRYLSFSVPRGGPFQCISISVPDNLTDRDATSRTITYITLVPKVDHFGTKNLRKEIHKCMVVTEDGNTVLLVYRLLGLIKWCLLF